jgi:hypothetical protein
MEPLSEAHRLPRRQFELEEAMRRPEGVPVTGERELCQLRDTLENYPAAVRAILDAAKRLHRPVDALTFDHIETGQ